MGTPLMSRELGEHFSWNEVTFSYEAARKGIANSPLPIMLIPRIRYAASRMEYVRIILGNPILVHSWYRSKELNEVIGGVPTSEHLLGSAVDFTCSRFGTPLQICQRLLQYANTLKWNQLILEHTWVHISFPASSEVPASQQVLTLTSTGKYAVGLTTPDGKPI